MSITHKTIFDKVKGYKGNPIDEYNKIEAFIKTKKCYYHDTIYDLLETNFQKCKLLRANYIDLNDCLFGITKTLERYKSCKYDYLENDIQDKLLDSFLTYCEVVVCVYFVTLKYYLYQTRVWDEREFDKDTYKQLNDIIKNSLKSINHDYKMMDDDNFEIAVFKCNPEAEFVAEQSPTKLKDAIYYYLGTKSSDVDLKENYLHIIIDQIEPLLKKYKDSNLVLKVEEYVQLIRHPEMKIDEKQYEWYFANKSVYLDELFMLCIFVKEYDVTKGTIKKFDALKKESNN